ncbi:MAG: phosphotransferase [Bacilli bacterium]|jgi:thiamine kinase-like enzyme|nr:phosphotransferase [Bacilli bacterium]
MRKESSLYRRLTGKNVQSATVLKGGLSNGSYLINGTDVLRIKFPSDPAFYRPHEEREVIKATASISLSPRLIAFDVKTGDMVSEFVEGTPFLGPEATIEEVASLIFALKRMHAIRGEFVPFDLWGRYEEYEKEAGVAALPREKRLKEQVQAAFEGEPLVLCHNDVVRGNVLKRKDGSLILVDYEFAGLNYAEFDFAGLYSENRLDPRVRKKLLSQGDTKTILMIKVANRLWHYWALARYKATGNRAFREIADEKLAAVLTEEP